MNIELKQVAQQALKALENSQPHPSNPVVGLTNQDFINHEKTIRQLRTAIQQAAQATQAEAKTDEPVNPTHWRAVLSEPQRPHELRKHLHTVLFREWDDAESWVASKLDFEGWQYTLEPLYVTRQLAHATQVEVTDEEIDYAVLQTVGFEGMGTQEMNQFDCRNIARAILTLRPAAVPMTEDQVWHNDALMSANGIAGFKMDALMRIVRAVEAHHFGSTAQAKKETL